MAIKKIKLPNNTTVDINDARDVVIGDGVENIVTLTNAEYQALATKDPETFYVITDVNPSGGGGGGGGGVEDVTLGGSSVVSNGVAVLPAYPTTLPASDVSAWAKASSKPTYTASEVGALPSTTSIPTESTVSGWGFTKNAGTITGITMNGASKGTSGVVDLGTVITSHQDISGKADKVSSATNGNLAGLNASGNLTDSGKSASDFMEKSGGSMTGILELDNTQLVMSLPNNNWSNIWRNNGGVNPVYTSLQDDLDEKQKVIAVSTSEPTSSDGSNGDIWIVI